MFINMFQQQPKAISLTTLKLW